MLLKDYMFLDHLKLILYRDMSLVENSKENACLTSNKSCKDIASNRFCQITQSTDSSIWLEFGGY